MSSQRDSKKLTKIFILSIPLINFAIFFPRNMTENFSRSAVNTRIFIFQRRKTRNISFESRDRKQRRLSRVFSQNAPITRPYRCTLQSPSNLRRNLKVELVIFRLASLSPTGIIAFASVKASLTAIKLRFENLQVSLCVRVPVCGCIVSRKQNKWTYYYL